MTKATNALTKEERDQFETLLGAAQADALALIRTKDLAGNDRAVVAVYLPGKDGSGSLYPMAVLASKDELQPPEGAEDIPPEG